MAVAGWKTDDMLQGLEGIMNLAAASGTDLGRASDIVTDALTAFGESAGEAGRLADIMAVTSSNANTNVELMGETFKYAAPVAGALGYSMEDVAEATGLMANAGIKGSQAGTSLRSIITRLSTDAGASSKKLGALGTLTEKLGVEFFNADGTARDFNDVLTDARAVWGNLTEEEKINYANTIAGKNAMSGWLALMEASPEDVGKLEDALANCDGVAQSMAATMQDNLAGKLTIMNSALEGLGIAIYNYFSGPLQKAVEIATNVISGITGIIDPPKSEMELFLHDIERSNKAVEDSIKNAQATVAGADMEVGKLETAKSFLTEVLDNCQQFNEVTLDDGRKAIVDASGNIVEVLGDVGDAAGYAKEDIEDIGDAKPDNANVDAFVKNVNAKSGEIETSMQNAGSAITATGDATIDDANVKEGTSAIVSDMGEIGEAAEAANTAIRKPGLIKPTSISGKVTTVKENIVKAEEEIQTSAENAGTAIEGIGDNTANIESATSALGHLKDGTQDVVVVTDAFTKTRITNIVNNLKDTVPELADAWNANTGELKLTNKELLEYIDNAEKTVRTQAYAEALSELYKALYEAEINVKIAQSGINEAEQEYAEASKNTSSATGILIEGYGALSTEEIKSSEALDKARESQAQANENYTTAQAEVERLTGIIEEMGLSIDTSTGEIIEQTSALDGQSSSAEDAAETQKSLVDAVLEVADAEDTAAESTEELSEANVEAVKTYKEIFKVTDEGLKKMVQNFNGSEKEFAEWCQQQIDDLHQLEEDYKSLVDSVTEAMHDYVTELDISGEEGSRAIDNIINNMNQRTKDLQQWVEDMKLLGQMAGKEMPQALYDQLLADGPDKTMEAVHAMAEAARNETGEFEQVAEGYNEALKIESEAAVLISYSTTGQDYAAAVAAGFIGTEDEYKQTVQDLIDAGVIQANGNVDQYTDVGSAAGKNTAEGVESQQSAVESASETVVEAGVSAAETAADLFKTVGSIATLAMSGGMNEYKDRVTTRAEKIVNEAVKAAKTKDNDFSEAGKAAVTAYGHGIKNFKHLANAQALEAGTQAGKAVKAREYMFSNAGKEAVNAYGSGISSGSASDAASGVAEGAYNALYNSYSGFYSAGANVISGFSAGINAYAYKAANAAATAAANALRSAKAYLGVASPSKEFIKIGKFVDEGFAIGIEKNKEMIAKAASDAAQGALDGAEMTAKLDILGAERLNAMTRIGEGNNGTARALQSLTAGMSALTGLAQSLSNPQAPNVTVMIGNQEFKGYIVNTAIDGMAQQQRNIARGMGL